MILRRVVALIGLLACTELHAVIPATTTWSAGTSGSCNVVTGHPSSAAAWNAYGATLGFCAPTPFAGAETLQSGVAPNRIMRREINGNSGGVCVASGVFRNACEGGTASLTCASVPNSTKSGSNCVCNAPTYSEVNGECLTAAQASCPTDPGEATISTWVINSPQSACVPNPAGGPLLCKGYQTVMVPCDVWGTGSFYSNCAGLGCEIMTSSCPMHWSGATCPTTTGTVNSCGAGFRLVAGTCTATPAQAVITQGEAAPVAGSPTAATGNSTSTTTTTITNNTTNQTTTITTTTVRDPAGAIVSQVQERVTDSGGEEGDELEIPDDYNRETTQQEIRDLLQGEETDGALDEAQADLEEATDARIDAIEGQNSTSIFSMSNLSMVSFFGISPSCDIPTLVFAGHTVDWNASWCPKIEMLRKLLAFVFWVFGAYSVFTIVTRPGGI